jgi:N-acetylglucosaminyldiphosphoundecaprenol N-acetyl-beta-D-mannosaminyltransferase
MLDKEKILGVNITNATKREVLEYIVKNLENFRQKLFLVTPNPEFLVLANKNTDFGNILNRADLALADGVGLMIASNIMGKPLKERFTGVDLVKSLCEAIAEKPITVGFLGGRGGIAEKTAECLLKKYPKLKIGFVGEEWILGSTHPLDDSLEPSGNTSLANENMSISPAADYVKQNSGKNPIKSSSRGESLPKFDNLKIKKNNKAVDILFVAFGAPKQEFWIAKNLEKIPVKIAVGVGGAFDYLGGKTPRAPGFIRSLGLEWLFRLIVQPWRIKRQLALLEFAWLVAKEKLNKN